MNDEHVGHADLVRLDRVEEDGAEEGQEEDRVGFQTADDFFGQEIVGRP